MKHDGSGKRKKTIAELLPGPGWGARHFTSPNDVARERDAVLEAIEQRLKRIDSTLSSIDRTFALLESEMQRAKIGDNHPPDPQEVVLPSRALLNETAASIIRLRQAVSQSPPDLGTVQRSVDELNRSTNKFKGISDWLAGRGTVFVDALLQVAAAGAIILAGAILKSHIDQLNTDVQFVLDAVHFLYDIVP